MKESSLEFWKACVLAQLHLRIPAHEAIARADTVVRAYELRAEEAEPTFQYPTVADVVRGQ